MKSKRIPLIFNFIVMNKIITLFNDIHISVHKNVDVNYLRETERRYSLMTRRECILFSNKGFVSLL